MDPIAPIAVLQKIVNAVFVEVYGCEGVVLKPAAEVGEQTHRILRRPTGVALAQQLVDQGVDKGTQRPSVQPLHENGIGTE